jgi:transglutaminase-like putative cysteine protease
MLSQPILALVLIYAAPGERTEAVFFDGQRAGFVKTTQAPLPGGKLVRASTVLELTLRRFGATVKLRREEATTETPDGTIQTTLMRQGQVGGKQFVLNGRVVDGSLCVRNGDSGPERLVRWPEGVLGPVRQLDQFAARKPKPGARFSFRRYESTYNTVLTVQVAVKDWEMVDISGKRHRLLRVELVPDKLVAGTTTVVPSPATWWLDADYQVVRRKTTLEGLGELIMVRSDGAALAPVGGGADIGKASLVLLDRIIVRPYDTREARYRVIAAARPDSLFPSCGHQTVKGKEIHVRPARGKGTEPKPAAEFLASCHFIDHDDAKIAALAKRIAAGETDAWRKAVKVERWVRNNMTNDPRPEMAPASVTARSLRGDCRHHAFLTAALCRAAGVPSRTAIGLLYVFRSGPRLGFHMWAEVFADGQWRGIDSTLGKGGVSAAHIKVADHSWADTTSMTPLLPVQAVLGKVRLELIEAR